MQVKPLWGDRKKGNINLLVKLYYETLSFIACVGNSRFECFIAGAPKNYGEHQNEQCKAYQSGIALIHLLFLACPIQFFQQPRA
jgi:hypothetical protein